MKLTVRIGSRLRRLLVGVAGILVLATVVAHTAPVRGLVLRQVVAALRTSAAVELRAASLSYNVFTLSAELRDVELAAAHTPDEPFGSAAAIGIRFGSGIFRGQLDVRRLSLTSPRVVVHETEVGTRNLPNIPSDSNRGSLALPDLHAVDLEVLLELPTTTIAMHGVTATFSPESGKTVGAIEAKKGIRIVVDGKTHDLDAAAVALTLDGRILSLQNLTAKGREISLAANGTLTLGDSETTMNLILNGSTDVASWQIAGQDGAAPSGHVDLHARLTGTIADPKVSFDANGRALAWQSVEVAAARAAGRYDNASIALDSFTADLASGKVQGQGKIALGTNGESHLKASWSNVDARQLLGASNRVARIVAPSGSAELRWRASGDAGSPRRFELAARTGVVAAGRTTALDFRARGAGERWRIEIAPSDLAALNVRLGADVQLSQPLWPASAVDGRLEIQNQEARALVERASDFGLPLGNIDVAKVAGVIDAEATFVGRLDAIQATGRVHGRALAAAGAPPVDLTSSFTVDLRDRTSTGDLRVAIADLSHWQPNTDPPLELRGSATATGTWSGPLTQPVVNVAVAGRNLVANRGGSLPVTLSSGTFDGTVTGPIDAIKGRGQLVLGDVDASGRGLGDVTLNLAVEGRSLGVSMSAPAMKTSIKGLVALESPFAFSANGTLTAMELTQLMSTLQGSSLAPRELGGTLSASLEASGDLEHVGDTTIKIVVAPLDAIAYGVPLRAPAGLRASVSKGRTTVDEWRLTIGAIAVRGDGELGLDGPGGSLSLDVDGDLGSLSPWLLQLGTADERWTAAGHINGTLGATRTTDGVVLTGSLASTLTTIAQGERVLARNAQVPLELLDSRLVIRHFTGELFGGTVQGSLDAPLNWLNAALPERWWIRQAATDAPATASLTGTFDVATSAKEFAPARAKGLGGRIVVAADLSTPRPDLQSMTGNLRLEQAEVTSAATVLAQTETTHLRLSGGQLAVETLHWKGPSSEFTGRGVIGLVAGAPTDARLDVDSELGVISDFLRGRAGGRLTGTIAIGGNGDDWKVTTDARLTDARWLVPEARVLLDGWSGQLRIGEDGLALADLGGRVNGGSVRIKGRLPVASRSSNREGGITIEASDVLLEVPKGLHSQLGGNVVWRLAEDGAAIEGTITITANRYSEPITRVLALVESLSRATGGSGNALPESLANTRLAVNLVVTDPVVVDNSVASLEIMPNLRLVGSVGSPALDGRIEVERGRIQIGGRTYVLRESRLRFEPAAGLAPTLDVTGDTRIGEFDVTLRMSGTPDGVETTYTSSPPLGQRDLQSLVVTGRTDAMGRVPGADESAASATAGDMLGFAGKFVGLDSVRLGAAEFDLASKDVNTDQHLTISKSFGPRFELVVSDNLETGAFTWLITWRPATGYEVRAASVENTEDSLEIRRIRFFGPGVAAREAASARDSATTAPRIVSDVVIDGAPGFPPDQLRSEVHIKAGDQFVVRRWIEDRLRLQNFYRKRGYHRVRIVPTRVEGPADATPQTISLRYEINRGPKTIIEIVGDDLPSNAVSAMYDEWHGVPVTELLVGQFEEIARTHLAEGGFHRARIGVEFPVDTPELARAIVKVDRGPQTHDQAIAWSGNAAVSTAELNGLAEARRSAGRVDEQSLAREVRQLYGSRGYLHTAISFGEPRFTGDLVTRPITIDEGRITKIADVKIDGVAPTRLQAATAALNLAPGTPYVLTGPSEAAKRLQAYYGNLGYRDVKVAHAVSDPKADVDVIVKVTVAEGAPYKIGAVSVSGVDTTNAGLVQHAITLEPGEVASSAEADATRRNLFEIGSFRRVDVSFVPPATPARATTNLAIQVEEPKRFQVRLGVQLSTSTDRSSTERGPITPGATVELRDRNFIGRAWQASLGAHYEKDFRTYVFLISAPRFFGRSLQTTLFARERLETESTDTASILDRRHELTLTQRKHVSGGLDLSWGYDVLDRVFLVTAPGIDNDFGGVLTGPTASMAVDRRDSPFDATRGWFHSSSVQVGLPFGANLGYVRFLTRQSFYQPIGPVTLAGNVRFGMMEGYSGTPPLTIVDQFFEAGGSNSVRGYSEGQLSAFTFDDLTVGGPELLVLNGEVRFPLHRWFKGAAFVDGGNTFLKRGSISFGELAVGAGIGLRVQTPLASIRFDVGYPMTAKYGSQRVRFHFSVGQMF